MKLPRATTPILLWAFSLMLGGAVGFHYCFPDEHQMELRMRGQQNEMGQAELPFNELEWVSPSRLAFECGITNVEIVQGTEGLEQMTIPITPENMDLLACVLETSERNFKHPVSFSIQPLGGKKLRN